MINQLLASVSVHFADLRLLSGLMSRDTLAQTCSPCARRCIGKVTAPEWFSRPGVRDPATDFWEIWDIPTRSLVTTCEVPYNSSKACWSADSRFICFTTTGSFQAGEDEGIHSVIIHDGVTGQRLMAIPISQYAVRATCWHPAGSYLLVHSSDQLRIVSFASSAPQLQPACRRRTE